MNKALCVTCAGKSGGVWPGEARAEFSFGVCSDCDSCCGVAPEDAWDWPTQDSHDTADVT